MPRSLYGIGRPSRGEAGSSQIVRSFEENSRSYLTKRTGQYGREALSRSRVTNAVQAPSPHISPDFAYRDVGKGREQDAEASESGPLQACMNRNNILSQ